MNVIFLDFDGVLNTIHFSDEKDIEKKIKILSKICKEFNSKIVISSSLKQNINEDTLDTNNKWVKKILELLKKYQIDCIGITPNVSKKINNYTYIDMSKEDEIRLYLYRHPEIEHYCIIDDNDSNSLNKLKDHLVTTLIYSENTKEEGLLESHKEEIGKILKKDNEIRALSLKHKK